MNASLSEDPRGTGRRNGNGGTRPGPPPGQEGGLRYPLASLQARALARGIDLVVAALPALLVAALLALAWTGLRVLAGGSPWDAEGRYRIMLGVVFFVLYTGYETVALVRFQRTLGKRWTGLRVAPASGEGRLGPLPVAALTVRAAVFALPGLLLFLPPPLWWLLLAAVVGITGGAAAGDRPNRQGVHDKVAGTVVLHVG
ncbi:RDD family protein [Nocardiopsis sp. CNT312]|uniref:RDD family protein n=1 Tax=Nocardiopsis sp. CNT312 TaxID=1137268 RepID=UPI0009DF80DA|nr:RDD family protein [Nocardiopsis sp. CNT312]